MSQYWWSCSFPMWILITQSGTNIRSTVLVHKTIAHLAIEFFIIYRKNQSFLSLCCFNTWELEIYIIVKEENDKYKNGIKSLSAKGDLDSGTQTMCILQLTLDGFGRRNVQWAIGRICFGTILTICFGTILTICSMEYCILHWNTSTVHK